MGIQGLIQIVSNVLCRTTEMIHVNGEGCMLHCIQVMVALGTQLFQLTYITEQQEVTHIVGGYLNTMRLLEQQEYVLLIINNMSNFNSSNCYTLNHSISQQECLNSRKSWVLVPLYTYLPSTRQHQGVFFILKFDGFALFFSIFYQEEILLSIC